MSIEGALELTLLQVFAATEAGPQAVCAVAPQALPKMQIYHHLQREGEGAVLHFLPAPWGHGEKLRYTLSLDAFYITFFGKAGKPKAQPSPTISLIEDDVGLLRVAVHLHCGSAPLPAKDAAAGGSLCAQALGLACRQASQRGGGGGGLEV